MRSCCHAVFLFVILLSASTARAEMPSIDYVAWYYKHEDVFKRIAEFFGGGERTARKVILRTDPDERGGLYFVCRLDDGELSDFPEDSRFILEVVLPDSPREKTFDYKLPQPTPDYEEIWLGLTGKDLPPGQEAPVAWRIQVKGPGDKLLTSRQSYLWSVEEPSS